MGQEAIALGMTRGGKDIKTMSEHGKPHTHTHIYTHNKPEYSHTHTGARRYALLVDTMGTVDALTLGVQERQSRTGAHTYTLLHTRTRL